jgi:hypothetical protein
MDEKYLDAGAAAKEEQPRTYFTPGHDVIVENPTGGSSQGGDSLL